MIFHRLRHRRIWKAAMDRMPRLRTERAAARHRDDLWQRYITSEDYTEARRLMTAIMFSEEIVR